MRPELDTPLMWRAHVCATLLEAGTAVLTNSADARARTIALDSLMLLGPRIGDANRFVGNIAAARLLEMVGATQRAFAAMQREVMGPTMELYASTRQRERARLADAVGDRESAIKFYVRYLEWRADAEPSSAAGDQKVRDALARLTADRR